MHSLLATGGQASQWVARIPGRVSMKGEVPGDKPPLKIAKGAS